LLAHVAILGFGFRRLSGLIGARLWPPNGERRTWTPALRIAQAIAVVVALYSQVPLALLYGVLGPNPAKSHHSAVLHKDGQQDRSVLLLDGRSEEMLLFDSKSGVPIVVPKDAGTWLELRPRN
jgi:hypothetical protein